MIKKVRTSQIPELIRLPESGMGYQFIEAETGFYRHRTRYLVLNSQILIEDTPHIFKEVREVFNFGFQTMLNYATVDELSNIRLVDNLANYRVLSFSASKQTGAIHQRVELANGSEIFTRLSAFENDFRVDFEKKKLVPGSYTTTFDDYQFCKINNINPVERYALPKDEPIDWAFHVQPIKTDTLQRGIVEPANNHNGGGVEAYFKDGTSVNTFLGKTKY